MSNAKKAPKKNAKAPPKKASGAKKPAHDPAPSKRPAPPKPTYAPPPPGKSPAPPAKHEPEFVKRASFAEKKAALEALAERVGIAPPQPIAAAPPASPPPPFVREMSPADRKAALEKVVDEQGVTGLLAKAPWKRGSAPPPAPSGPPTVALPADRAGPRVQMTKAPLEQTTGKSPPSTVILDSNALMMQFQFHIDIEKEVNRLLGGNYTMVVPQIVVDELGRLAKEGAMKEAAEARMAIELAKTFDVVESPGDGDTGILRAAERLNAIVVTNDKRLRAQLRAKDIPNIYMRSRAFLTIDGHIPGM
jgi:rRNA-processing protein FCF1